MPTPKKIFKIVATTVIALLLLYNFLLSDYNPMFKNEKFNSLNNQLKTVQKEDLKSFTTIYTKIHETVKERRCPCEVIVNNTGAGLYRHGFSLTQRFYLLKIEKEFTHEECLKFQLLNADFNYKNIGIKSASKFYFNKTIEQLNETEKVMFIAMLDNSSLYNPIRNKQMVKNRVRLYKMILNKNR